MTQYKNRASFHLANFLSRGGLGREIIQVNPTETLYSQGDQADYVFYLQSGRVRLTAVSLKGKEATITLLHAGDFAGEAALATVPGPHLSRATALSPCTALKIARAEMIRVIHQEVEFSGLFTRFLLRQNIRMRADIVDHIFNSSERRLARLLLLMAGLGELRKPTTFLPYITQESLADMIGTTRSRVSFFMNRFRRLGFIDYKERIQVHQSLRQVLPLEQLPLLNTRGRRARSNSTPAPPKTQRPKRIGTRRAA